MVSDGIAFGPELLRHGLADDDDSGGVGAVIGADVSALE